MDSRYLAEDAIVSAVDVRRTLFRNLPASMMMLDTKLRYIDASELYLKAVGCSFDDIRGRYVFDAFPETSERLTLFKDAFERALAGEPNTIVRHCYAIPDRAAGDGAMREVWWTCYHAPAYDPCGEIYGMVQRAEDVTAQVKADKMKDLLARELNHRVKNLFAVVQALVMMSAKGETDVNELARKVRSRIAALSAAHVVTTQNGELGSVPLREIVLGVLAPYDAQRIAVREGADAIDVPRRAVTPIGLVLHELATNAVKYGALSQDSGAIEIAWRLLRDGDQHPKAAVEWKESFVPQPGWDKDMQPGFGSRLMLDSAKQMGGTLEQTPTPSGLHTSFTFKLD